MPSSFSLKMPSTAVGPLVAQKKSEQELFFPVSSWNFVSKIPSFLSDEETLIGETPTALYENYGRRTLKDALQIINSEKPQCWKFQILLEGNPDLRPIYALGNLYTTIILGASINENGKWRLHISGNNPIQSISEVNAELAAVPEYYKTAIHEVAILLVQQYTNYHWMN